MRTLLVVAVLGLAACSHDNGDVDECLAGTAKCSPYAKCVNLTTYKEKSFTCRCLTGLVGDGFVCTLPDGGLPVFADAGQPDAGTADAGPGDGGEIDGGTVEVDGGLADGGEETPADGGETDGGAGYEPGPDGG